MGYYDIFNGDADGICALHQLRLAEPRPDATLISGVKRDIRLLAKVPRDGAAHLTVLDISMASNMAELVGLLERCQVLYIDHHFAGDMPESENLTAHIDPDPDVCTSLIVDRLLGGRFRAWAVVAAFGDNLHDAARQAAATLDIGDAEVDSLRELGELMNYNGYGKTVADLHYSPQELYRAVQPFPDPLAFIAQAETMARLRQGYADDMAKAEQCPLEQAGRAGRVVRLPAAAWARRVAGVYSNKLARQETALAHALVVDNGDGTSMISVRAPLARKSGADALCRSFPTGGGRAAAAGINRLPADQFGAFMNAFSKVFAP